MTYKQVLTIILLAILLTNCQSDVGFATTPENETLPTIASTIHLTPSITRKTKNEIYAVPDIPQGFIYRLAWADDSEALLFQVGDQSWSYNLLTQKSSIENNLNTPLTITPNVTPQISLAVDKQLVLDSVSPSGKRAILTRNVLPPSPTPWATPTAVDGEETIIPQPIKIFTWENGKDIQDLMEINSCGGQGYIWTDDERFVVIQTNCLFTESWAIDLDSQNVFPILPLDEYGGFVYPHSFSPDQSHLLIQYEGNHNDEPVASIYLLKLDGFELTQLSTPQLSNNPIWINDEQLIIKYRDEFHAPSRPALFNLQAETTTKLLDEEHDTLFEDARVRWMSLSPDKQHLAITVDQTSYQNSELWLIKLSNE